MSSPEQIAKGQKKKEGLHRYKSPLNLASISFKAALPPIFFSMLIATGPMLIAVLVVEEGLAVDEIRTNALLLLLSTVQVDWRHLTWDTSSVVTFR
jgi:hypothetical protein